MAEHPADIRRLVLKQAGYLCANPACRTLVTLDTHHLQTLTPDGSGLPDDLDDLLPLCPNCHAQCDRGEICAKTIRAWKMLMIALNGAFDRRSIDILLALKKVGALWVSGDAIFYCSALIASGFVEFRQMGKLSDPHFGSHVSLSSRGQQFVDAWKQGDQDLAIRQLCNLRVVDQ